MVLFLLLHGEAYPVTNEKSLKPWELIRDKTISQLVFSYEMVLTEMRTHARANRTIKEWVDRLDRERDEFVQSMPVVPDKSPDEPKAECPHCREVYDAAAKGLAVNRQAEPKADSYIDAFLAMALPRIADLMQADPEDATPDGRELMLLADLADRYERQKYPEFSGRPVRPHRSGGGGPPTPERPIEPIFSGLALPPVPCSCIGHCGGGLLASGVYCRAQNRGAEP